MFCKAKTSVTSWWSLNSENNEMTAAVQKTQPQQMRPTHSLSKTLVKKSVVHMPAGETGHKAPPPPHVAMPAGAPGVTQSTVKISSPRQFVALACYLCGLLIAVRLTGVDRYALSCHANSAALRIFFCCHSDIVIEMPFVTIQRNLGQAKTYYYRESYEGLFKKKISPAPAWYGMIGVGLDREQPNLLFALAHVIFAPHKKVNNGLICRIVQFKL